MNDITAKEKAKQLIFEFYDVFKHKYPMDRAMSFAKECALICVDEILNILSMPNIPKYYPIVTDDYWQQVKTEIENYE